MARESWTTGDELAGAELTAVSAALQRRAVSVVELTELMIDRVGRYNGALHAYVAFAPELARRQAEEADREIEAGRWRGLLHGIPMAIKDVFYTTQIKTGLGSSIYAEWEAPFDSTATRKLREAGAILLGKLTATEGVYADHHPTIPAPLNPFGAGHWTGTSSSGSGVAVTAGLAFATLGTDTGGSIRLPSACCGVVGVKPTWGRVSRHGVFPLAESLDHVGPMARSAKDAAAILGAIAGPDPADPTSAPVAVPDYMSTIEDGIAGLTIGIDWAFLRAKADDEVLASIEAVQSALIHMGAQFTDVTFPGSDSVLEGWAVQCAVEAALAHSNTYPACKAAYGKRLAALLDRGHAVTGLDLAKALTVRRTFTGSMALLFDAVDLLLVPALPVAGPSLEHMASLGEDPAAILAIGPFTAPFDVCGYPTITLPCDTSQNGIPIGFQFVGRPFSEALLCRAGHAYQIVTDWHRRRPTL